MNSILQTEKICYLCGSENEYGMNKLEDHHIFGAANRNNSEKYGLKVWLCACKCHRYGKQAAHQNAKVAQILHEDGQQAFERVHGTREEFMQIFGKNYL